MFDTLIITLREGVEAFLIVAVIMSYLAKTGRKALFVPVYWAIGVSILTSIAIGYAVKHYINSEFAEGIMAITAAILVFSMTIHMMKAGKHLSKKIKDKLEMHAQKTTKAAAIGVFMFVVLMISREGMEIAILLHSLAQETDTHSMLLGGIGGVMGAALVSYLWIKYSHLINLGIFLQMTAIFLAFFSVHLLLYGLHEITEGDNLPFSHATNLMLHNEIKAFSPLKKWTSYASIFMPLLWFGYVKLCARQKKTAA